MHHLFGFFSLLILSFDFVMADPLGTIPEFNEDRIRVTFTARSDLWLSPYEDKETPLRIYQGQLRLPITRFEKWTGSVSLSTEAVSLGRTDLLVGHDRVPLSSNLQEQSLGLGLSRQFNNKSSFSVYGAYTSASDEPFQHDRDTWTEMTALYLSPRQGSWQGVMAVNYSKNRGILNNQVVPLFGALYHMKPGLQFAFGLAFLQMNWAPNVDWLTIATLTPLGAHFESNYVYTDSLLFLAKFGVSSRSYLHVNRTQDSHRLIFEEKYLEIGFKRILSPKTYMGFTIGTSFDRSVYEAETVFQPRGAKTHIIGDFTGGFFLEFQP